MLEPAIVAARVAQYLAAAMLFGAPAFLVYAAPVKDWQASDFVWPRPLIATSGVLLAVATLSGAFLQTVSMSGSLGDALAPGTLAYVIVSTDFGRAAAARAAAAFFATGGVMLARTSRPTWLVTSGLGALALGSLAWSGHGAGDDGAMGEIHLVADLIHLWASGAWIGALVVLSCILLAASSPERVSALHTALSRFSGIGAAAVGLLLATGLVNSWFLVGPERWRMLFVSLYGGLLLFKIALFLAMLALAAANRFGLTPRLGAAAGGDRGAALKVLRLSLFTETLLAAAVLAIVGVLGVLTPISAQ